MTTEKRRAWEKSWNPGGLSTPNIREVWRFHRLLIHQALTPLSFINLYLGQVELIFWAAHFMQAKLNKVIMYGHKMCTYWCFTWVVITIKQTFNVMDIFRHYTVFLIFSTCYTTLSFLLHTIETNDDLTFEILLYAAFYTRQVDTVVISCTFYILYCSRENGAIANWATHNCPC